MGKKVDLDIYYLNKVSEADKNVITDYLLNDKLIFWDLLFYYYKLSEKNNNWCDVEKVILDFFLNDENNNSIFNCLFNYANKRIINYKLDYWLRRPCIYLIQKDFANNRIDKFLIALLEELEKFEKRFGDYIHNEYSKKLYNSYQSKVISFINKIKLNWEIVSIDTFNYTPLEAINDPNFLSNNSVIYHINGDYTEPIFGIDSSKIIVGTPGYNFTKTYRRSASKYYENHSKNLVENDFDNLVIFGHSLNEQDYSYYFPLFNYMNLMDMDSKKGICVYYTIHSGKSENEIKNDIALNLTLMLNAYEKYKTGRTNECRLFDDLFYTKRLKIKEPVTETS